MIIYPRLDEIADLRAQGLVSGRPHPTLPLTVYNYTAKSVTLSPAEWSPTLCDCRGLILGPQGEIVGRPFRKFWNYEQVLDKIPVEESFSVAEKLDGSLGVVANYQGQRVIATRGSFESEQADWAGGWFAINYPGWVPESGFTYLFEIIYPENRIVVDYHGREECVLLEVLDWSGKSHPKTAACSTFPKARLFPSLDPNFIKAEMFPGEEGFVVRWESGFRAKIKLPDYVRLHRLITQVSTRSIWDLLRNGQQEALADLVKGVPADFQAWVQQQIDDLTEHHDYLVGAARVRAYRYPEFPDRKAFALWATTQDHPALTFAALDNKNLDDAVWKLGEPKFATPFRASEDA